MKDWILLEINKRDDLHQLPNKSGLYMVCDKSDNILYIGKSVCLRSRWWYSEKERSLITPDEIRLVLKELKRKEKRSINTKKNHIIFRLIISYGCLPSEICALQVKDIKKMLNDIYSQEVSNYIPLQYEESDLFIKKINGKGFDRHEISKRWKSAIKILGTKRVSELSARDGRKFYLNTHNIKLERKQKNHKMLNYVLEDGCYLKYKVMDKIKAAHEELNLINKHLPPYNIQRC